MHMTHKQDFRKDRSTTLTI